MVLESGVPHPFQPCGLQRGASSSPLLTSRPSSLLRKERARCPESKSAIDESKRALTLCPMHPVRPGGTLTTDSSSPSRLDSHFTGSETSGERLPRPTAGGFRQPGGCPDAATRPRSPPRIHPDDSRSIRPPGYPLASPRKRPATLARRKPPGHPPFSLRTERRSAEAPFVVFTPSLKWWRH